MKIFRKNGFSKELKTVPLDAAIGVELAGFHDITRMTKRQSEQLKGIVKEVGLVVIKGKRFFTETEQRQFTGKLGDLDGATTYSTMTPSLPQVKVKWPDARLSGLQWHSDRSFQEEPSHLSIFQMAEIPKVGNETSFICLNSIYNALTDELKAKWSDLYVTYMNSRVQHPLIWNHPFNGRRVMYFDFRYVTGVKYISEKVEKMLPMKEINAVIEHLQQLFSCRKHFYEHFWNRGDIIIVDNFAVAHKVSAAVADEFSPRMLVRTSTRGVRF